MKFVLPAGNDRPDAGPNLQVLGVSLAGDFGRLERGDVVIPAVDVLVPSVLDPIATIHECIPFVREVFAALRVVISLVRELAGGFAEAISLCRAFIAAMCKASTRRGVAI